jgi:hypothetical protein
MAFIAKRLLSWSHERRVALPTAAADDTAVRPKLVEQDGSGAGECFSCSLRN